MLLSNTFNCGTLLILAVGIEPLIGAVSYPKSIKACSKLVSGICVIWLKPTNVNPKNKSRSSFFIV